MAILIWVHTLLLSLVLKRMCETTFLRCEATGLNIEKVQTNSSPIMNKAKNEENSATNYEILNLEIYKNSSYQQCRQIKTSMTVENSIKMKKLCMIKNKWYNEILKTHFGPNHFSETRRQDYNPVVFATMETRPVSYSDGGNYDCVKNQRQAMRPYPGSCYTKKFGMNWLMWRFWWSEVYGDIMFTFDYVLYNRYNRNRKENQFWYLILYLKTMATLIENPVILAELDAQMTAIEQKANEMFMLISTKLTEVITGETPANNTIEEENKDGDQPESTTRKPRNKYKKLKHSKETQSKTKTQGRERPRRPGGQKMVGKK